MACFLRFQLAPAAADRLLADWPFGRRRRPIAASLRVRDTPKKTVGVNVRVSDAGFDAFSDQLSDARRFLRRDATTIAALVRSRGVRSACLDFGVADTIDGGRGPAVAMFFRFSPELIELVARARLDLEFSVYPAAALRKKRKPSRKPAGRAAGR